MIEKVLKAAVTPCYGKAESKATRCKLNIPKEIANAMNIVKGDCTVKLTYNEKRKELKIKKVEVDND